MGLPVSLRPPQDSAAVPRKLLGWFQPTRGPGSFVARARNAEEATHRPEAFA